MNPLSTFLSICACLVIVGIAGCSFGDNLAAYFNTYYNAQRLFSEAEEDAVTQRDPRVEVDYAVELYTSSPQARQKFTSVVEKCSKLLQYHPESDLVDDALFLIGKSYYYQNDLQQGERKFLELLDGYPTSSLANETKFLLASSYYKMRNYARSETVAKDLLETSRESNGDMACRAGLILASIEIERANELNALRYEQMSALHASSSQLRSLAYRRVGNRLASMGSLDSAAMALRESFGAADDYAAEYRAQISLARVLSGRGRYEESFAILTDQRENSNNKDFYGEIDLATAEVYQTMGDFEEAIAQYTFVDTAYARTEVSLKSYLALGKLYEHQLYQYDSARVTYTRGRGEYPQSPLTAEITRRADYLNRHDQFTKEITRLDSIKSFILLPPEAIADEAEDDSVLSVLSDSIAIEDSSKAPPVPKMTAPTMSLDTVDARLAYYTIEMGGLFYSTIGDIDSARAWYVTLLDNYPQSEYVPRAVFTLAQIESGDSVNGQSTADSLYRVLVREFPESEFGKEADRILGGKQSVDETDPASRTYESVITLIDAGESKSALDSLRLIVKSYPESPFASKAQYALGWVYEEVTGERDSAVANYRRLLALYPSSEYSAAVQSKVTLAGAQSQVTDTTAVQPPADGETAPLENPFLPPGPTGKERGRADFPPQNPPKPDDEKP